MDDLLPMCRSIAFLLLCSLLTSFSGCKKRDTPPPAPRDVCGLITLDDLQTVQGSPIRETKNSARSDAGFRVSQCFYTATEFSKSVNLALVERDPGHESRRSPKDFWKERFGRYSRDAKKSDKVKKETERKEEREESVPPKKIDGIADEAFWVSNRFGGTLYVLKGDVFLSISLGGTDDEATKLTKSKALAQQALRRL